LIGPTINFREHKFTKEQHPSRHQDAEKPDAIADLDGFSVLPPDLAAWTVLLVSLHAFGMMLAAPGCACR